MKTVKIIYLLAIAQFVNFHLFAQIQQLNLTDQNFGCSYIGKPESKNVYAFETNSEAVDIIDQILTQSGLEPNFKVYAADVNNAEARVINEERVIIYNQNFIHEVRQKTGSDWAATSILAHEVAHHLQGHTIKAGGSRPGIELESDKWSGFILYKLGASLDEAQLAIKTLGSSTGSATHPAKSARIQAIAVGWTNARHMDNKNNNVANKPSNLPSPTSNEIPSVTEKIVNPPPKVNTVYNPKNDIDDFEELPNEDYDQGNLSNNTNFYYLGNALFTTQTNVQILINGMWYTPPSNEFHIENIPYGNQTYRISGTITVSTDLLGSYDVYIDNTGYMNVGQNNTFYIIVDYDWSLAQFSMRISPTNY